MMLYKIIYFRKNKIKILNYPKVYSFPLQINHKFIVESKELKFLMYV